MSKVFKISLIGVALGAAAAETTYGSGSMDYGSSSMGSMDYGSAGNDEPHGNPKCSQAIK